MLSSNWLLGRESPCTGPPVCGAGFLCDSGSCPAVAKSVNGDSYEITGAGTFNPQSKSVSAAGTFAHKIPNGTVVETGVWTSNQLLSFDLYGAAPNALRQRGIVAGVPGFRPNLLPMSVNPVPVGGLAVFHIRMLPASGMPMAAALQVNCALAETPRDRSSDGIRLKLERNPTEFSEELGGSVMFLAMPPQPPVPGKGKQQEPESSATQAPNNKKLSPKTIVARARLFQSRASPGKRGNRSSGLQYQKLGKTRAVLTQA